MPITVTPLPQALGAVVEGLDLDAGLDAATVERLRAAWYENLVLFFPGIHLTEEQHIALGSVFGALAATTTGDEDGRRAQQQIRGPRGEILVLDGSRRESRADMWHTDVTFAERPPIGSLLSMQVCPTKGGDTLWSNQYAAYESLSPAIRALVDGLEAVHGRPGITASSTHPVVVTHPGTGRRALFVNRGWTSRVEGLTHIESRNLLNLLYEHAERPELFVRWTWTAGDAALWDNRCTMHYAVNDYGDAERILHRVTIHEPHTDTEA
jgi:taurine dioxygenase